MEALLIIWIWNAAERGIDIEPMPDVATCEIVLAETLKQINTHKTFKGPNRGAAGICVKVPE